jgi:heat shock protein HtpX
MAFALVLLAMTYAALWFGVYELFHEFPGAWPYWVVVALALAAALVSHYDAAGKALLASVGAEFVDEIAEPGAWRDVDATVQRLASLAEIRAPRLAFASTDAANAFAVGFSPRRTVLVVTRGLRERLTSGELQAVLAHELSHIVNRDAAVMTAVAGPRILGEVMIGGASSSLIAGGSSVLGTVWFLVWPFGLPFYVIGSLLTLTVSRCREFAADRGSAMLTGAPEQLMSALQKLSAHAAEIPHEDLRAANAFCIVSTEASVTGIFSDHPPLEKRLAALAEIAREMGKPVQ